MTVPQPSGTPAEPAQQPQAGTPPSAPQAGTEPTAQAAPSAETMTLEEARKLRQEHNALRKRVAEYEAAAKAAEDAKLGELERAQKTAQDAAQAAEAYRNELAAVRLENAAIKANALDADAVVALLSGKITFEDGKPTNVDDLVKELQTSKPHLFVSASQAANLAQQVAANRAQSGGATNPGRSAAQPPAQQPDAKAAYQAHRSRGGLGNRELWKR